MLEESVIESSPLWGEWLTTAIHKVKPEREMLIEGFLPTKSNIMVYANDGVGKSIVTQQALMQASSASPVFGYYEVPRPVRTIWIQCERDVDESLERMKSQVLKIPFEARNFILEDKLQGANLNEKNDVRIFLERISYLASLMEIDVIVIDPIYALVDGDMNSNKDASKILGLCRILQKRFGCSVILIHHTNRGAKDEKGNRGEGDMFGSRFFSAQCTGTFHLKSKTDGIGCDFYRTKNSHQNLDKHIDLLFDIDSQVSTVNMGDKRIKFESKYDEIINFLRTSKMNKQPFTIRDIVNKTGVSTSYVKKLKSSHLKKDFQPLANSLPHEGLYEYVGT